MKKIFLYLTYEFKRYGKNIMTPELLWKLGRVTLGISKDGKISFTK
jgi:hypothetical protein